MKKIYYLLLGLMLVLSTALVSCSKDDDDTQWNNSEKKYHNGYEYVDLGLPSGTMWAASNVGTYFPEGYGN